MLYKLVTKFNINLDDAGKVTYSEIEQAVINSTLLYAAWVEDDKYSANYAGAIGDPAAYKEVLKYTRSFYYLAIDPDNSSTILNPIDRKTQRDRLKKAIAQQTSSGLNMKLTRIKPSGFAKFKIRANGGIRRAHRLNKKARQFYKEHGKETEDYYNSLPVDQLEKIANEFANQGNYEIRSLLLEVGNLAAVDPDKKAELIDLMSKDLATKMAAQYGARGDVTGLDNSIFGNVKNKYMEMKMRRIQARQKAGKETWDDRRWLAKNGAFADAYKDFNPNFLYELDANGNQKLDSNGNPIVKVESGSMVETLMGQGKQGPGVFGTTGIPKVTISQGVGNLEGVEASVPVWVMNPKLSVDGLVQSATQVPTQATTQPVASQSNVTLPNPLPNPDDLIREGTPPKKKVTPGTTSLEKKGRPKKINNDFLETGEDDKKVSFRLASTLAKKPSLLTTPVDDLTKSATPEVNNVFKKKAVINTIDISQQAKKLIDVTNLDDKLGLDNSNAAKMKDINAIPVVVVNKTGTDIMESLGKIAGKLTDAGVDAVFKMYAPLGAIDKVFGNKLSGGIKDMVNSMWSANAKGTINAHAKGKISAFANGTTSQFISGDSRSTTKANPELVNIDWANRNFSVKPIPTQAVRHYASGTTSGESMTALQRASSMLMKFSEGTVSYKGDLKNVTDNKDNIALKVYAVNNGFDTEYTLADGSKASLIEMVASIRTLLASQLSLTDAGNQLLTNIAASTATTAAKPATVEASGGGNPFLTNSFPSGMDDILEGV